jgi:hypothetical protein
MAVEIHGMGVKLLNYTAAGKPIVSFQGSAPGLAHKDTAWLIEGADPGAFRQGILDLECASAPGRKARRFVDDH